MCGIILPYCLLSWGHNVSVCDGPLRGTPLPMGGHYVHALILAEHDQHIAEFIPDLLKPVTSTHFACKSAVYSILCSSIVTRILDVPAE